MAFVIGCTDVLVTAVWWGKKPGWVANIVDAKVYFTYERETAEAEAFRIVSTRPDLIGRVRLYKYPSLRQVEW